MHTRSEDFEHVNRRRLIIIKNSSCVFVVENRFRILVMGQKSTTIHSDGYGKDGFHAEIRWLTRRFIMEHKELGLNLCVEIPSLSNMAYGRPKVFVSELLKAFDDLMK